MGPKLKLKIRSQGVHLRLGKKKERAGTLPRVVEKFTSRLECQEKGWYSTSFVELETSPFRSKYLRVRENLASSSLYLLIFLVFHLSS